jgi:cell division protein FtsA
MASLLKNDTKFEYTSVDGRTVRECARRQLIDIIQPRLDQIFVMIEDEVRKSGLADAIVTGGVIITGGGAKLEGMVQACEQAMSSSTRLGLPQDVKGPDDIVSNLTFATAMGLIKSEMTCSPGQQTDKRPKKSGPSWISRVRGWVDESF